MNIDIQTCKCSKSLWMVMLWLIVQAVSPCNSAEMPAWNQSIRFERISLEEGLSQNTVSWIFQDSMGFMWFCTQDGLNKYDGYNITVYRHDPDSPHSLSNNWVHVICEGRLGEIWIGTEGGGLNKFDPKTETFSHYKHDPQNPNSLSKDVVLCITEDRSGILWIGTEGGGLNKFDPKNRDLSSVYTQSE